MLSHYTSTRDEGIVCGNDYLRALVQLEQKNAVHQREGAVNWYQESGFSSIKFSSRTIFQVRHLKG